MDIALIMRALVLLLDDVPRKPELRKRLCQELTKRADEIELANRLRIESVRAQIIEEADKRGLRRSEFPQPPPRIIPD